MIGRMMLCFVVALGGNTALAAPPFIFNQDTIDVTTNFRGTNLELTTFLDLDNPTIQMVIVGPRATLTFREKERRAGMWVNASKVSIEDTASYFAFIGFNEGDLEYMCASADLQGYAPKTDVSFDWVCDEEQRSLMAEKGLFVFIPPGGNQNLGRGFHRITAFVPPTAKPGAYDVRLSVNGSYADAQIDVRRAGLERLVLETAQNSRLFYGIVCLVLAALAGYLTNLIFSRRS